MMRHKVTLTSFVDHTMSIHYSTLTLVDIRTNMYISISSDDIKLRNLYRTRNTVEKHGYNTHVIRNDGHSYKSIVSICVVYVTYVQHDKSEL